MLLRTPACAALLTSLAVPAAGQGAALEYNIALGERRAIAVRDYLASRGIPGGRMRTVSYGEERPIADNNTAEGRAINRRVHLAVIIQ